MAEWKLFPMGVERPTGAELYDERGRAELELIIALQVSTLLADYAFVELVDADNSDPVVPEAEANGYYYTLGIDPFSLDDGGELIIQQVPPLYGRCDIRKGLHSVERTNSDEATQIGFAVWDPKIDISPRIMDFAGAIVPIQTLQELHEALITCGFTLAALGDLNSDHFDTSAYPEAIPESDMAQALEDFDDAQQPDEY